MTAGPGPLVNIPTLGFDALTNSSVVSVSVRGEWQKGRITAAVTVRSTSELAGSSLMETTHYETRPHLSSEDPTHFRSHTGGIAQVLPQILSEAIGAGTRRSLGLAPARPATQARPAVREQPAQR